MKIVIHTSEIGRKYAYELPDDASESDVEMGILLGPPDVVDALEYPEPFATRLHNILAERKIYSWEALQKDPNAIKGALQAALGVDMQIIQNAYLQERNLASVNGMQ